MEISASYEMQFANGKNSSKNFRDGSEFQAGAQEQVALGPEGRRKLLKARIVRREILAAD